MNNEIEDISEKNLSKYRWILDELIIFRNFYYDFFKINIESRLKRKDEMMKARENYFNELLTAIGLLKDEGLKLEQLRWIIQEVDLIKDINDNWYADRFSGDRDNKFKDSISVEARKNVIPIDLDIDWSNQDFNELMEYKIKKLLYKVNIDHPELEKLIIEIVKDNVLTKNEIKFLETKLIQFGYDLSILEDVKNIIDNSNPAIDHLIHLVLDSDEIKLPMIEFLKEKIEENQLDVSDVNKRFWQILFLHHRKIFFGKSIIEINFVIANEFNLTFLENKILNFEHFDIFNGEEFSEVIIKSLSNLSRETYLRLQNKKVIKCDFNEFDNSLKKISEAYFSNYDNSTDTNDSGGIALKEEIIKIINEEKFRIGTPDVELFVENVKFRLATQL